MNCAVCGEVEREEEFLVFSPHAYNQVVHVLKINKENLKNDSQENSVVSVCLKCLQGVK
jgi:hypothetical protein